MADVQRWIFFSFIFFLEQYETTDPTRVRKSSEKAIPSMYIEAKIGKSQVFG